MARSRPGGRLPLRPRRRVVLRRIVQDEHPVEQLAFRGGVKSRSPVFGNVTAAAALPVRGLNHHAFTFVPVILFNRTENVRPTGA